MIYYSRIVGCLGGLLVIAACGGNAKKVNYTNPKSVSLAFYRAWAANNNVNNYEIENLPFPKPNQIRSMAMQ